METIQLKYPIKRDDGSTLDSINLRRVTYADVEAMDSGRTQGARSKVLLTRIAELTPDEVGRLDYADYGRIDKVIVGFMDPDTDGDVPTGGG